FIPYNYYGMYGGYNGIYTPYYPNMYYDYRYTPYGYFLNDPYYFSNKDRWDSINVPTGTINVPTGTINVPTEIIEVPTGTVNIPTGTINIPTGTPNIPPVNKNVAVAVNKVTGQVIEQVHKVSKEAIESAQQEWENLKSQAQSQAMQQIQYQFNVLRQEAMQSGMTWFHNNFYQLETFANKAIEWGMKIRDAIVEVRNMIIMLQRLLANFNKRCRTPYSTPINIISVNIPIVNRTFQVSIEICYPFNPATLGSSVIQTCQNQVINQASQTITQGVVVGAASGGTGIVPALSQSFTRAMSEAPGVFATCVRRQMQNAYSQIELRVLMG
ncbi:hypothetical protein, partial [Priestia megaterium]|uniref:hypothetical protein n=1 Tax=Priestia megaterium TaxID=1404 RepID=UPI00339550C6